MGLRGRKLAEEPSHRTLLFRPCELYSPPKQPRGAWTPYHWGQNYDIPFVFVLGNHFSESVRVRFRVRFRAVKVPIFGVFSVEKPTKKANRLKALLRGVSLSEYGSKGCRIRLRGLSEYGSVACLVERPTRETHAEQYSDTVLIFSAWDKPCFW